MVATAKSESNPHSDISLSGFNLEVVPTILLLVAPIYFLSSQTRKPSYSAVVKNHIDCIKESLS